MAFNSADRIAVSTWSLHRMLGTTYPHNLDSLEIGPVQETYGEVDESLLDIPSAIANHGINRLELVSFHLPSKDPVYLGELRSALSNADVALQTLLIDAGDISDPATSARDTEWIWSWIEIANQLGAERARVIAGKQKPTRDALDLSVKALTSLAERNAGSKVRLTTENWFDLLAEPAQVHYLLDKLDGRIGLNGDFGNWGRATKYDDLRAIFGRAETCHAKGSFADGKLDEADYGQCLQAAEEAGYKGPYTLIFDAETPDEWAGIETEKEFIEELLK
ncbi:MAG: sugar phosphate isomerase/epimerase [Devosia sp.]|uniref:sugar phosphate isomerase/epimerase family protein n=1 Tax=Devosia sp. TaxID=1871048 RepID=UPI00261F9DBE|nr:sugar phosphate isomerase/epimerase [Devosia sp.]MDB5528268.1 sugar phosphate isomerase/epimerase [Devosia sp.]